MFAGIVLLTFLAIGSGTISAEQQLLGAEKCTWGPAYWCGDISSAKECGAVNHCLTTTWKNDATDEVDADDCCTKCEKVVDRLRNYAVLTERDTVVVLNSACDAVPFDGLRQQCKDGVQTYVKEIMDMVVHKIDPKKICTLIRLCKKSQNPALKKQQPTFARVQLHRDPPALALEDTETCAVCKLAVLEAKNYISNADNQKEIVQLLKTEGCSRCPAKAKCEAAIDEYAPIVFKFLMQELDGSLICNVAGLCSPTEHILTPALKQLVDVIRHLKDTPADSACDVCKNTLKKVRDYFANPKVRAAVKDLLRNKMCLLCPARAKCQADIVKYVDKIFTTIDSLLAKSDQICQKIGLCPKTESVSPVQMTSLEKKKDLLGVQCTICEFVMKQLDDILKSNRSEEAIIAALDKVCSLLPKTVNDECVSFVGQYGKMIINLLAQELEPAQICTAIGLCSGVDVKRPEIDTTLKFSPFLLGGAPMKMGGAPMQKARPTGVKVGPQCVLCEYIMSKLETLLFKNATEQDVINALDKVCSLLPASIGGECKSLVDEYGPAIIKILASEMKPAMVCTFLGLCPLSEAPLPSSNEFCEACETAMMYVDSLLKENATQQEIEHLLLKICNYLPEAVRGECNMVVMLYTPELVQMLVNQLKPELICSALKLCSSTKPTQPDLSNTVPMQNLHRAQILHKAKNLLGVDTKKCMYGPSYWCASRFNAKRCKMTAHCQEHYWSKKNV